MTMEPTVTTGTMTRASHKLIGSDRVEGTSVRRPDGQRIGSIKRLMIDKISGQVAYAILNFGGFLGLGQSHYPIPWDRLKYDSVAAAYELDISDDELKHASDHAAGEDFDWGDRTDDLVIREFQHKPTYWGMY